MMVVAAAFVRSATTGEEGAGSRLSFVTRCSSGNLRPLNRSNVAGNCRSGKESSNVAVRCRDGNPAGGTDA